MPEWPNLWTEIRDRWLNGSSTARIAKALHVDESYVHNMLPNVLADHRPMPTATENTPPRIRELRGETVR